MDKKEIKVLLVENNAEDAGLVEEMLRACASMQFQLERVENLTQGFRQLLAQDFDIMILDLGLSDSRGLDTFRKVRSVFPNIPIVVLTGLTDEQIGDTAVREGAEDYLIKGEVSRNALIRSLRNAIERKEVVRRQEEKERVLWSIFNDSPTLIAVQDSEGKVLLANRAMAELYGVSPQAMIGRSIRDGQDFRIMAIRNQHPAAREQLHLGTSGARLVLQESFLCPDGSVRYFQTVKVPILLRNKGEGVLSLASDISEKVEIQDVMLEHRERFDNLLKTIQDAMSMIDQELNIVWANASACRIFGKDIIGKKCYEVFHKKHQPCEPKTCATLRAMHSGEVHSQEIEAAGADGQLLNFYCVANVVYKNNSGKAKEVISLFRDITEYKKVQQDIENKRKELAAVSRSLAVQEERQKELLAHLHAAGEELKRLNRDKDADTKLDQPGIIAAEILHEIKNYLGIITLGTDGLVDKVDDLKENSAGQLAMIRDAARRAQGIIAPLLNFARSSSKLWGEEDLLGIIDSAVELVRNSAKVKHIDIKVEVPEDKIMLKADGTLLRQVFLNLLSNSIDAIESEGVVLIKAIISEGIGEQPEPAVTIEVSDTGLGIPDWAIAKIFEPFFTTKKGGRGTGLGLSLARMIVEKHNGKIFVASKEGQGATFTVILPLGQKSDADSDSVSGTGIAG